MQFKNLTKNQVISYHLSLLKEFDEKTIVFSSLIAVLRDAREITGRDINKGERIRNSEHGRLDSWLGALGYLTVLDQIGKCYRPKNEEKILKDNNISRALKYFTSLSNKEVSSIYALRCAFSHDYSLFNVGKKKSKDILTQHFTVTGEGYPHFIILPKTQWNGIHSQKNFENMTYINLPFLGDVVEAIYKKLTNIFILDQIEIELEGGHKELIDRYLMFIDKS